MAKKILGRVALNPRGQYVVGTTYDKLDVVTDDGSSYLSKVDGNTTPLTNTTNWQLIASKGKTGSAGFLPETVTPSTTDIVSDGIYYAQTAGTYSGVVVREGYYTLLRKTDNTWSIASEVEMPTTQVANTVEQGNTNAVTSEAVYDELKPIKANFIRNEQFYYTTEGATLSILPAGRTIIRNQALSSGNSFKYLRIYVAQSGVFQIGIFEKPTSTTMKALRYTDEITLSAGNQVVELPTSLIANQGEYIGVFCKTGRIYADTTKASQLGGDKVFTSGKIELNETQTTTGTSNYDLFSLFENYTIDERIDNASNQVVNTVEQNNTNAVTSEAVYDYVQPIKQKFEKFEPFAYTLDGASLISRPTLRTILRNKSLTVDATFKYLNIFLSVGGKIQVGIFEKVTPLSAKAISYTAEMTLPAGNQTVELPTPLTATAGQYIGIYFENSRVYADGNRGGAIKW